MSDTQKTKLIDKDGTITYLDESKLCKRCGKTNVIIKPGSRYVPQYCPECAKQVRKLNLTKARRVKHDKERKEMLSGHEKIMSPSGCEIVLRNNNEKKFYASRLKSYTDDYDMENSADKALLARLLSLEVECKRLEEEMSIKFSSKKSATYMKLTDEMRKVQQDLGISRSTRINNKKQESVGDKIIELVGRYKEYQERNQHRFTYICEHCGKKNILNREIREDNKNVSNDT